MSTREIVAEELVKKFGQFQAVKGVSFKVNSGEIFGFLGPNGAGKSTTISMLTTLSVPTAGRATVGGFDVATQAAEVRRIAGVALQEVGIDPLMKSLELLTIQGQILGLSRRAAQARGKELLDIVKLSDRNIVDRRVGKYSGGMRRRLDLALALVHEPSVLFLDEPTTGLDPASRRDIWDEVRRLNSRLGVTIFLTTQYLEEADELTDRIAIIDGGVIVAEGTPTELKSQIGSESINVAFKETDTAEKAARAVSDMATRIQADGHVLRLYMSSAAAAVPAVVNRLQGVGLEMASLTLTQPTLDDVFLNVTGKRLAISDEKPKESRSRWARAS
jgi:ABC-2 type transport system ATP-binding protein